MIRIVIIEDEPATARHLYASLQELTSIELMATIASVAKAISWLEQHPDDFDLIFMDIHLSDGLSFDICKAVRIQAPIIFVTAYSDYALQAFKTSGIDYILKPFARQDLSNALDKFNQLRQQAEPLSAATINAISEQLKITVGGYKQSFLVHYRDKLIPLQTKEIAWFYTLNEVCHALSNDGRKFVVPFTLEQLQQQLDPSCFFRANRKYIVQRNAILEVSFYFNGRLVLSLAPSAGENVLISKAKVPEFKAWMNQ